jgi:cell division transport system permease protein
MRAISYAVREALVSMRRGGRSAAVSIVTIAIAFLTLGAFLLISFNLQRVAEQWAAAAEMSIYLDESLDESGRAALTTELQQQAAVAAVEFVSKTDALERFRQDFPELADVAAGDNPFPSSLEVRLRSDPGAGDAAAALATSLAERPGVADVRYDRQWLARLLGAVATIRVGGLIVAAVLVLGAAFTVAAVVRLSLESRHTELDIMQLVGAPSAFVRGPSIAEGTLLGGLGALVALLALWALYSVLRTRIDEAIAGLVRAGGFAFLPGSDVFLLLGAGLLVGAAAGAIASRAAR